MTKVRKQASDRDDVCRETMAIARAAQRRISGSPPVEPA